MSGVTSGAFKLADKSPVGNEMFTILVMTRTGAFTQIFSNHFRGLRAHNR